jgi:hypothetical protein
VNEWTIRVIIVQIVVMVSEVVPQYLFGFIRFSQLVPFEAAALVGEITHVILLPSGHVMRMFRREPTFICLGSEVDPIGGSAEIGFFNWNAGRSGLLL